MVSFFSWQNALKTYMPNVWRKPQKANITEGVLKLQFGDIHPLLGAADTTIHSRAGSCQHLACSVQCMFWSAVCRSVTAQCGELQPWSQRKCSGGGGGRAACSTASLHSILGSPLDSESPLAPSVQKLESNLQVLKFYWPYIQQYPQLRIAMVQLSSDSVR